MAAKKTTKKDAKNSKKKKIVFNKYAIWFQSLSIVLAIVALTLNVCDCIAMDVTLDLFCISVLFLAFSLFPKKESL